MNKYAKRISRWEEKLSEALTQPTKSLRRYYLCELLRILSRSYLTTWIGTDEEYGCGTEVIEGRVDYGLPYNKAVKSLWDRVNDEVERL
jgi:hypothetical protein